MKQIFSEVEHKTQLQKSERTAGHRPRETASKQQGSNKKNID